MGYLTDKLHKGSIYNHVAMKHYTVCLCLLHTVDPGNYYAFPECLPQQSHPTGRIVVKQLEDVHPSLQRQRNRRLSEQCRFSKPVHQLKCFLFSHKLLHTLCVYYELVRKDSLFKNGINHQKFKFLREKSLFIQPVSPWRGQ